jgi:competence protein ComEC
MRKKKKTKTERRILFAAALAVIICGEVIQYRDGNRGLSLFNESDDTDETGIFGVSDWSGLEIDDFSDMDLEDTTEVQGTRTELETQKTDYLGYEVPGNFSVTFFDVGQGDCLLIDADGSYMLIDAGNNDKGTTVQKYLEDAGVESLDYFIVTHPDADHCGGADVVIEKFDIGTVLMPGVESDTATFRDVQDAIEYTGVKTAVPKTGDTFYLGDAVVTVLTPGSGEYEDTNQYSIGVRIVYGDTSFLLCGDMETENEEEILESGLEVKSDVMKLNHHGSANGTNSEKFIEAVSPKYAVVSCGYGNSYGHPHKEVMDLLEQDGISLYRTDLQGTVTCHSDGSTLTWSTEPSDDYRNGNAIR